MDKRITGLNSHGFTNEELIVNEINCKKINELNTNLKRFIKDICKDNNIDIDNDMTILSRIEKNNKLKQDLYIIIKDKEFGISVKMGTGNSVHQEKIEEFIKWIYNNSKNNITDEVLDCFRFFIWADGSIDGKANKIILEDGTIKDRFGSKDFKKIYPKKRELLQETINKNEREILNRVIFEGKYGSKVDYVYHGTKNSGAWISKDEIIDYNIENSKSRDIKNKSALSAGRLTIQAWNVSLKGNTENKRGEIQFKYSSMEEDFNELYLEKNINKGTFQGDKEEFNISKFMNKNKKHKFWTIIGNDCNLDENSEDYYVVKVDGNKKSKLSGKKVKCKSDSFVIKAKISKNYLLKNEYILNEDCLEEIKEYDIIKNSGISVKMATSSKYTIGKLTHNTFKKAFEKYIEDIDYIIYGLFVYTESKKINFNNKILKDLNIEENKLKEFYFENYGIKIDNVLDENSMNSISKKAREITKNVIELNKELKEQVFTGKGWFDNPYYINFIFKYGDLSNDLYMDYVISNGSGRSKGIYTIILKPQ